MQHVFSSTMSAAGKLLALAPVVLVVAYVLVQLTALLQEVG